MTSQVELTRLSDGLGVLVTVDGARPLAELTVLVNDVCADVERTREQSVVVLALTPTEPGPREWPGEVTIAAVNRWERALRRLERLDVVNIAVVEGTCGGPALDLLLAADFRIGSPDLRLVLPVNDGHFWPGMSLYRLVQHIGLAKARQIVLWGVDIPVGRASELGLIDQVSDNISDAINTAAVLRGRISDRETGIRRQLLLEATAAEYDEALGAHLASCDRELRRLRDGGTQTDTAQPNTARSSPASTSTGLTNPTRTSPAPTEVAGP